MVTIESSMHVPRMRADSVVAFMSNPTDELYREWWPGTHLSMHPLNDVSGVGQCVYMDEFVGDRRLRMQCVITEVGPGKLVWQFKLGFRLPCWLTLVIEDDDAGATITHTISAGYRRLPGLLLDPLFRLYFSARFATMMDEHFTTEFSALPDILERHSSDASA